MGAHVLKGNGFQFFYKWLNPQTKKGSSGCHGSNQFNSFWPLQEHDQIFE